MGIFKRRKAIKLEKKMDKAHVEDNITIASGMITLLVELTDNANYKAMLSSSLDEIKFFSPISVTLAAKIESKIIAKLDDIKISISSPRREARAEEELNELHVLIVERKAISN